jgi:hypothetical protein
MVAEEDRIWIGGVKLSGARMLTFSRETVVAKLETRM